MPSNEQNPQGDAGLAVIRIRTAVMVAALGILTLALLALNDQSLWIDELGTWRLTVAASLAQWFQQFVSWPNSDAQIPLYHFYMRLWVTVFPSTEVSLRAANLPWLFAGLLALLTTPAPKAAGKFILLVTVVVFLHPMVWYYANEARPYAMIVAGSCVSTSGLLTHLLDTGDKRLLPAANSRLVVGTAMLAGTSIVGLIWSVAFVLPVLVVAVRDGLPSLNVTGRNRAVAIICCLLLLPVAYQYASTVLHGVGATALHENTLQSFASGLYEVAGFGGIGPGREQLRSEGAGVGALGQYALALALYGIVTGLAIVVGMFAYRRRGPGQLLILLICAAIPLLAFFVLGSVKHWRVLGRHMVPLLFFYSLFLACGIQELARKRATRFATICANSAAAAALLALAASSLEISHAQRHRREDVKSAAHMAADFVHAGNRTWWVALSFGAEYYRLPIVPTSSCAAPGTLAAVVFESPTVDDLKSCLEPEYIFLERPDTYDMDGAVRQYAQDHQFRRISTLQGFEILEKSAAPPAPRMLPVP
jgi:hypothetical protein